MDWELQSVERYLPQHRVLESGRHDRGALSKLLGCWCQGCPHKLVSDRSILMLGFGTQNMVYTRLHMEFMVRRDQFGPRFCWSSDEIYERFGTSKWFGFKILWIILEREFRSNNRTVASIWGVELKIWTRPEAIHGSRFEPIVVRGVRSMSLSELKFSQFLGQNSCFWGENGLISGENRVNQELNESRSDEICEFRLDDWVMF